MSMKKELATLAEACEVCAMSDDSSIDDHMLSCPSCQDHEKKAEEISQMVQTMQMLASKPEEERRLILSARIDNFASMPELKRFHAISDMLDSLEELTEEQRVTVIKTRTNILTSASKVKRDVLMGTLKDIMHDWDMDRKTMEQRAVMAATDDYMFLKRTMVRRMFKKLMS
jgi:hypothetical protein